LDVVSVNSSIFCLAPGPALTGNSGDNLSVLYTTGSLGNGRRQKYCSLSPIVLLMWEGNYFLRRRFINGIYNDSENFHEKTRP
jgi:hypothetical protein